MSCSSRVASQLSAETQPPSTRRSSSAFFTPRFMLEGDAGQTGSASMKTRAAVLHEVGRSRTYAQTRPLAVETLELDPPGEGEVLVRSGAAGLCHSDLSVVKGERPGSVPMEIGHEAAVEVVEVGRDRKRTRWRSCH